MASHFEEIERLAKLLDDGKITQHEYDQFKRELLNRGEDERLFGASAATELIEQADPAVAPETTAKTILYRVAFGFGVALVFLGGTFAYLNGYPDRFFDNPPEMASSTTSTTLPYLGFTIDEFQESWDDARGHRELIACTLLIEREEVDQASCSYSLPSLDNLEHLGVDIIFWGQDLISPTTFLATSEAGAVRILTVWAFEPVDSLDQLMQMHLLCEATYLYDLEDDQSKGREIVDRCGELLDSMLGVAALQHAAGRLLLEAVSFADGVYWKYTKAGEGFSLQAQSEPWR